MEEMASDEEVQSAFSSCSSIKSKEEKNTFKRERTNRNAQHKNGSNEKSNVIQSLGHDNNKSAFIPYQPTTILTNLQRGNMKSENHSSSPELNLFQLVAQGEVFSCDIEEHVHEKDENGMTLLMWASAYGQANTVEMLLNKKANVNATSNIQNACSLQFASSNGHIDVVKLLIKFGADVNHTDIDGNTPLIYASYNNHACCANALLNSGSDMNIENELWQTALSIAISRNCTSVQTIIERYILKSLSK